MRRSSAIALLGSVGLGACTPNMEEPASLVTEARVLAISAAPAEAAPATDTAFRALYVDANGELAGGDLAWAYCSLRQPLAEPGAVNTACLRAAGSGLGAIGDGLSVKGALPKDGCSNFGPNPPTSGTQGAKDDAAAGVPGLLGVTLPSGGARAADPDASGGYYQPLRVLVPGSAGAVTVFASRIACGVGGADPDTAKSFTERYRLNTNPTISSLAIVNGSAATAVDALDPARDGAGATVSAGRKVSFRVSWPACPTTPVCGDGVCGVSESATSCAADCATTAPQGSGGSTPPPAPPPPGCAGAEQYLWFDGDARTLELRREGIRASWFATGGSFDADRTGRAEAEAATSESDNGWTAPDAAGDVRVWVVLRDDRGGVGWQGYRIHVTK